MVPRLSNQLRIVTSYLEETAFHNRSSLGYAHALTPCASKLLSAPTHWDQWQSRDWPPLPQRAASPVCAAHLLFAQKKDIEQLALGAHPSQRRSNPPATPPVLICTGCHGCPLCGKASQTSCQGHAFGGRPVCLRFPRFAFLVLPAGPFAGRCWPAHLAVESVKVAVVEITRPESVAGLFFPAAPAGKGPSCSIRLHCLVVLVQRL